MTYKEESTYEGLPVYTVSRLKKESQGFDEDEYYYTTSYETDISRSEAKKKLDEILKNYKNRSNKIAEPGPY